MGPISRWDTISDFGSSRIWEIESRAASDRWSFVVEEGIGAVGGSNSPANRPLCQLGGT